MTRYDFDIGIIGGGAAGLTIASGVSQLGMKTLLIEKAPTLGGDCLHFGCVPSKTLIKSASVYHMMHNATRYGLPEVELPPVNFTQIEARIRSVIDVIQSHDSKERFSRLGVSVAFGEATFVDEHVVAYGGKRVSAQFWVIATGAGPASLPVPGLEETGYLTNKNLFSLSNLPSSLIILGGGPIGCEMAQAFSRLGTDVRIVQRNCQLLSNEDKDMATIVLDQLRSEGVQIDLCSKAREVRRSSEGVEVIYEIDGNTRVAKAERLLVAAGRSPNVHGLNLESAGVLYDARGVKTDDRLRTSQKHIFAAGDVLGKYQFTHAAGYEGGIVISNVAFRLPRKVDYTWLPRCTYTDPEFACIGMNEKTANKAGLKYSIWEETFAENDRALAENAPAGKIKLLLNDKGKPLGVQIVGAHAGELVAEWVAVLNSKMRLSSLVSSVHPYPTLGEINKKVAGTYFSTKLFSPKIRKILNLVFGYSGNASSLDKTVKPE